MCRSFPNTALPKAAPMRERVSAGHHAPASPGARGEDDGAAGKQGLGMMGSPGRGRTWRTYSAHAVFDAMTLYPMYLEHVTHPLWQLFDTGIHPSILIEPSLDEVFDNGFSLPTVQKLL